MAEVPTTTGLKTASLVPENLISQFIQEFNPELALKMMQAGTRVYLYGLAGYQVKAVPSTVDLNHLEVMMKDMLEKQEQSNRIAQKYIHLIENTRHLYPFLETLQDSLTGEMMLGNSDLTTCRQWLSQMSVELSPGDFARFSQRVSSQYRVLKGKAPTRTINSFGKKAGAGYTINDLAILDMVLSSLFDF